MFSVHIQVETLLERSDPAQTTLTVTHMRDASQWDGIWSYWRLSDGSYTINEITFPF